MHQHTPFPAPATTDSAPLVNQLLLTDLLQQVQDALSGQLPHPSACQLAPFASSIVAVDQCELSAVAQLCEETRVLPKKSERLLVGKLSAVFDVGRQQWRPVQLLSDAFGDGTLNALLLLSDLPTGSLILADLGYFGFQWFQYLSDCGHFWISRLKSRTRYQIQPVLYQQDDTLDALVWLGV